MVDKQSRQILQHIFSLADIQIGGNRPWDIQVHNQAFFTRVLAGGSLALGESYMDGWWDCKALDEFFTRILKAKLEEKVKPMSIVFHSLRASFFNMQSKSRARIVGEKHYDIGNELYSYMLDKRMTYSCGYWKNAKDLNQAQDAKLDLICRKVGLKKGMKVLDIGCGWGSFAKFAAEKYQADVVGITISKEQTRWAKEACKGLPVDIRLQDYRDVKEKFDRIISIGMFEHVGYKNHRVYLHSVYRSLNADGLFLLHTIGNKVSTRSTDPWMDKYIFPNGMTPSARQITQAAEGLFNLEDWHNFGTDYDKTLMSWYYNFNKSWPKIKDKYDQRFYRMWTYYLLSCAGHFRTGEGGLWQIVFSKNGIKEGYKSVR